MDLGCAHYRDALLDLLEQEGAPEARRDTLVHLAMCPTCEAEFRAFERLKHRLEALGALLYQNVQSVDVRAAVLASLQEAEEVAAPEDAHLELALGELGKAVSARAPRVNLVDEVMATVAVMRAQEDANPGLSAEIQMDFQAFMEDELDAEGLARIEAAAQDHMAVQREFEALRTLKEDLLAIGRTLAASTPPLDLLYAGGEEAERPNLLLARVRGARARRTKQTAPRPWSWVGLAAAACLVFGLWIADGRWMGEFPNEPDLLAAYPGDSQDSMEGAHKAPTDLVSGQDLRGELPKVEPVPLPLLVAAGQGGTVQTTPEESDGSEFGVQDVLNARREAAMGDGDASTRLALWASLAPEQARKIVEMSDASVDELLGAARFLAIEEARQLLEAAVAKYPTDAGLRAALAENYAHDPALADASRAQLAEWSRLDPGNGLPHYMEAQLLFDPGYTQAALDRLTMASSHDFSSAYGLNAANEHAAALIAAGMDPNLAGLLAASTAGSGEYANLMGLTQGLLAQGQQFEALGDFDTAQQIYDAVRQLGVQVEGGAAFANEQLAGLESQRLALDALAALGSLSPENIETILQATEALVEGINTLLPLRSLLDQVYASIELPSVGDFVSYILSNGDLSVHNIASEVTGLLLEGVFN